MSISSTPMRADYGAQTGPKVAQPAVATKAQAGVLDGRTPLPGLAATQAVVERAGVRQAEAGRADAEQVRQSLREINKVMNALSISVQFEMDPDLNVAVISVVDQQSGKVIRQLPSEDALRVAKALDNLKGLLFAQTA